MIPIASLTSLGFFYMGFLIPIIARMNMNASALQIGFIVSALVIGFLISSSFVGILTDRTESKKTLIFVGSIGRGLAYSFVYFAIIINSLIQ